MAVNNIVKRIQNIMRGDAGVNGDAQRIEQMVWIIFLKVYDAQEEVWELEKDDFKSIIPEELRWRNWAHSKDEEGKLKANLLPGGELLKFIDNTLFPVLQGKDSVDKKFKGIKVTPDTPRGQAVVKSVFEEAHQYMKDGVLLRQVIDVVDELDLLDTDETHLFGDIYEGILKDLQSAGNAGEFYTPRGLTDFIIKMLNPRLGETVGDFAMGTGGFLVSALKHLYSQCKTSDDVAIYQNSVIGQEWKPFPYLLAVTNIMLNGIENPQLYHMDSLDVDLSKYHDEGKVDVIAMNPPYGGTTSMSARNRFKKDVRSSETADLFIVLIMERLAKNGRAGIVVPDGFLFGNDTTKMNIKTRLLKEFNLHTIIRLPSSIFSPYTSIATNVLFFSNEKADGAKEGFCTKETWFYRMDMPDGYVHFNKSNPMKLEHTNNIQDWWRKRVEIVLGENDIKSKSYLPSELIENGLNLDLCKFPKEEEVILNPEEMLCNYWRERKELESKIDNTLSEIEDLLGIINKGNIK